MKIICPHCGKSAEKYTGHVKRAKKMGNKTYCSRKCSGLGRRKNYTLEQKKKIKADYDKQYRQKNLELIKKKKHDHFKKTYDPKKAAIVRKKRMPYHLAYCRTPKYRAWKHAYDQKYHAKKNFGVFWESFLLIKEIEKEYSQREARAINNLHVKSTQKRKRKWQQLLNNRNYQQRI